MIHQRIIILCYRIRDKYSTETGLLASYTRGAEGPVIAIMNVMPDKATVWYFIRESDDRLDDMLEWSQEEQKFAKH